MYIEIFANDIFTQQDVIKAHSLSLNKIDRFCVPGCMLKEFDWTGEESLGLLVDYPYGLASTESRKREITEGYSKGVRHFDLTISRYHLLNKHYEYILNDLKTLNKHITERDQHSSVRCLFDFSLCDKDGLIDIAEIIMHVGINMACISSGYHTFDIEDQFAAVRRLNNKSSLQVYAGPIYTTKQYEYYTSSRWIEGVFFNSVKTMTNFTKVS